jgi:hypothetical protein
MGPVRGPSIVSRGENKRLAYVLALVILALRPLVPVPLS